MWVVWTDREEFNFCYAFRDKNKAIKQAKEWNAEDIRAIILAPKEQWRVVAFVPEKKERRAR
jgi:hypothetical protein